MGRQHSFHVLSVVDHVPGTGRVHQHCSKGGGPSLLVVVATVSSVVSCDPGGSGALARNSKHTRYRAGEGESHTSSCPDISLLFSY